MIEQHSILDQIHEMALSTLKLIPELEKLGITFKGGTDNEGLRNVTFTQGDKVVKMSWHSFYRYSGMLQITRTKKDSNGNDTNWTEVIPLSDLDWLQKFIKPIVIKLIEEA